MDLCSLTLYLHINLVLFMLVRMEVIDQYLEVEDFVIQL